MKALTIILISSLHIFSQTDDFWIARFDSSKQKYGYQDIKGKWRIKPKFEHVETDTFRKFAYVVKPNSFFKKKRYNLVAINKKEKVLFSPLILDNSPDFFNNHTLRIVDKNEKIGFINDSLEVIIEPKYDNASQFQNGVATIYCNGTKEIIGLHLLKEDDCHHYWWINGKYAIINKDGDTLIKEINENIFKHLDIATITKLNPNKKNYIKIKGNTDTFYVKSDSLTFQYFLKDFLEHLRSKDFNLIKQNMFDRIYCFECLFNTKLEQDSILKIYLSKESFVKNIQENKGLIESNIFLKSDFDTIFNTSNINLLSENKNLNRTDFFKNEIGNFMYYHRTLWLFGLELTDREKIYRVHQIILDKIDSNQIHYQISFSFVDTGDEIKFFEYYDTRN